MIEQAVTPILNLKVRSVDNGHCQVYYRCIERQRSLYCMQEQSNAGDFQLLICSSDGEPESPVNMAYVASIEPPKGDERVEEQLRAFLKAHPLGV